MPEDKKNIEVPTLESYHYFLLCKEIDMASAEEVIKFILERNLMLEDRPSEIRLILNSPGGETQSAAPRFPGKRQPLHRRRFWHHQKADSVVAPPAPRHLPGEPLHHLALLRC